jgi:signal transduction histidine kinase
MRSLRIRLPLMAAAILAVSLGMSTLLAYEILLRAGHREIQIVLERERDRFELSIRELITETPVDLSLSERLAEAGARYLALNPSNETYVSVIRIPGRPTLASASGPAMLRPLLESGEIPVSEPGTTQSIDSDQGELRSLVAPIVVAGQTAGLYQVVAPLDPISDATDQSLLRMLLVAAISLVIGALLLALALYRALRPLSLLAGTARSTEFEDLGRRVPQPAREDEVGLLAREFNAMLTRLERAAMNQREFLAAVSHELRTPITIARGHVETLERLSGNAPAVGETAGVLREELERMGRLVEDLMTLARSQTPTFVIRRPMSVPRFFNDLRLRLSGLGTEAIELHAPPDVWVDGDDNRLGQALLNLIVNARVHTPSGTAITVGARSEGDWVAFFVSDNGTGIDADIRDRVFEPFVRGETGSSGYQSTGLGMAVVQAIVDAHDGTVDVRSDATGTEVTIRLRAAQPNSADTAVSPKREQSVMATDPAAVVAPPAPKAPR